MATGEQRKKTVVKVLLFGRLGELDSRGSISIELGDSIQTVADIRKLLSEENPILGKALAEPQNLIALNQNIVNADHNLSAGDELAFLPPVTGG